MFSGLLQRTAKTLVRVPALVTGPLLMSAFFLLIYTGQLGKAGAGMLPDGTYLEFILPLVLITTAFNGGAVAGQLLVRDMTSGYHDRLLLTGAGRTRVVGAPLFAAGATLALQAAVLVVMGLLLGLREVSTVELGALVVGTTAAGLAFALLGVAAAVWSRTDAAVNATVYLFFPLSFLTSAFAPRDELSGWLRPVATANPLTYVLEALRGMSGGVAPSGAVLGGVVAVAAVTLVGLAACSAAFRHAETAR
jgi:ABC-2 type transport system permease protein